MLDEPVIPSITVVTAAYNAIDGLRKTTASLAKQHSAMIEHVVVDGGSSDGSPAFLASLSSSVIYVSEPDQGIADAMNKGIAMSSGEYVLILQAGDILAPGTQIDTIVDELDGSDIISFDVLVTHADGDIHYRSHGLGPKLERSMSVPHQGAFVRRDLYERIGGFDASYKVGMDYEFMLRAKRAGASCKIVNRIVAIMPADGISARRDWPSLSRRLAENRRIQSLHARGLRDWIMQKAYWALYPFYKRLRHLGGVR